MIVLRLSRCSLAKLKTLFCYQRQTAAPVLFPEPIPVSLKGLLL